MKSRKVKLMVVEELHRVPIVEIACKKNGISRATFYRWLKSDAEFAEKVEEALSGGKEFVSDIAESQLISAIKRGQISAMIFWLKHHRADYKPKLEINGEFNYNREALTPEELQLLTEALRMAGFPVARHMNNQNQLP